MEKFYYAFCNHWTQAGIGFAFPFGYMGNKKYYNTFSTVYTINKMLDAADDFPGLVVGLELDSYAYEEVLKEAPECIERLRKYINEGKACIEGGTYGQPLGQDYGWESNIKHLTQGRNTIKEVLHYDTKTFLVEEQWFHPQMPQLLNKSGFKYASLQNQNSGQVKPSNESIINWKGIDGSSIPTIPSNNFMVSCVRQYTDYNAYKKIMNNIERPLLFQWIEIWPPGMDWGASAVPFEKAINQVLALGGECVSLSEYLDNEVPKRKLKQEYITLDQSNYANNWYQGGGWGYDGDRVIAMDRIAEQQLLAYDTLRGIYFINNKIQSYKESSGFWKRIMILQNHDVSVARTYRAFKDGVPTECGLMAVADYKSLIDDIKKEYSNINTKKCDEFTKEKTDISICILNYNGINGTKKISIPIKDLKDNNFKLDGFDLICDNKSIPYYVDKNCGREEINFAMELPKVGIKEVKMVEGKGDLLEVKDYGSDNSIENSKIKIQWIEDSWGVKITDKCTGSEYQYYIFSGNIGKMNEHDAGAFHALSPGHETFTFAFDGTTHCPDQTSTMRIECTSEEVKGFESTLVLRSNLLTLHTTEIPVAFAEARITYNHITGNVEFNSLIYTGVYLNINAFSVLKHNIKGVNYYRDFPFGEELTQINNIYCNTYLRADNDKEEGFILINFGNQKVDIVKENNCHEIRQMISRGKVLGEYNFKFVLSLGKKQTYEAIKLSKDERRESIPIIISSINNSDMLTWKSPEIILSALEQREDKVIVRIANYSEKFINKEELSFSFNIKEANLTDFNNNIIEKEEIYFSSSSYDCDLSYNNIGEGNNGTAKNKFKAINSLKISLKPWEIKTLQLKI